MTSESNQFPNKNGGAMLALFSFLSVLLLARYDIPRNDVAACAYALVTVLVATTFDFQSAQIHKTKRFLTSFKILTLLESLTIIVPWILIIYAHVTNKATVLNENIGYLLAPHLLVFQVQIALECIVFMSGQKWLLFPYTCLANGYRYIPLSRWLTRSFQILPDIARGWEWTVLAILPIVTTALWFYSSFVFLPYIWYPLLKEAGDTLEKRKEEEKISDW